MQTALPKIHKWMITDDDTLTMTLTANRAPPRQAIPPHQKAKITPSHHVTFVFFQKSSFLANAEDACPEGLRVQ
jgi:hypothetical protein